jgi:hypothetical protein
MRKAGQQDQTSDDNARKIDGKKGAIHGAYLRSGGSSRWLATVPWPESSAAIIRLTVTICS